MLLPRFMGYTNAAATCRRGVTEAPLENIRERVGGMPAQGRSLCRFADPLGERQPLTGFIKFGEEMLRL